MSTTRKIIITLLALMLLAALAGFLLLRGDKADLPVEDVTGTDPVLDKPDPEVIPTVKIAKPVGWGAGEVPRAAPGMVVSRFAEGLEHPRVLYTLPNGDVLVALTRAPAAPDEGGITGWIAKLLLTRAGALGESPNQIVLLRDGDGDGSAEVRRVILDARSGLDAPSGIAWREGTLYVANHDALLAYPYGLGQERIAAAPRKLMDLPAGGNHWMRNIAISPDGTRIYVAVGSASNIAENGLEVEQGRAMIWEYDLAAGRARPYAMGLRNANGLDFSPWTEELWTTVNERDMLGSDLVPDYLTNVPIGAHYGWPWVYWRDQLDPRVKAPRPPYLSEYTRKPEYALGPHVAALGLAFTRGGHRLGEKFASGAVIARHGSWNRKPPAGYDVIFVSFDDRGNPTGKPKPLLWGWLREDGTTRGRPTWVGWAGDGALLISDDTAGIIWRVLDPDAQGAPQTARLRGESLPPQRELKGDPSAAFREDYVRTE